MAEQAALEARRACERFLEVQLSGVDTEGRMVAAAALRVNKIKQNTTKYSWIQLNPIKSNYGYRTDNKELRK